MQCQSIRSPISNQDIGFTWFYHMLLVAGWPFFGNGFKFRPGVTYDLPKGALN
jgi:hypothetical protein